MEKSSTDGFIELLMGYARSRFREFESFLVIVVASDEDGIHLNLKQSFSFLTIYVSSPGLYIIKDTSKAVDIMGDNEGTLQIESNGMTMKTKPNLTLLGSKFCLLRFDEKTFLNNLLGFTPN